MSEQPALAVRFYDHAAERVFNSLGFLLSFLVMREQTFSDAFARVTQLVEDFQANEQKFLDSSYSEAQARSTGKLPIWFTSFTV